MKDPCRVCGLRLVGSQCRWIFSSTGTRKLQVILSHVLGREVTRDGCGEFLCGKCVFQLEKVMHFDVTISRLQDEQNAKVQKLQAEKEHLIQCIVHTYSKNNAVTEKGDGDSSCSKTPLRSSGGASPEEEAIGQLASEGQQPREGGVSRIRRRVSLDRIGVKGPFPGRSGLRRPRLESAGTGLEGPMKNLGLQSARHHSQCMYLDLVYRKGALSSPGFKGRSISLQALNRDFPSDTPPEPSPKRQLRQPKVFASRSRVSIEPVGTSQARALLFSSPGQPSVISDLIHLLRCISCRPACGLPESRIPLLQRPSHLPPGHLIPAARPSHREAGWRSLQDLAEEFDDEYTPVRVEVALFSHLS